MNYLPEPNSLREQFNHLTLVINIRASMNCHMCGRGGPEFGHTVGGNFQSICGDCRDKLYPVLSELDNVQLTFLEIAALFDILFGKKPRTIYFALCQATREGKLCPTKEMGPLGRMANHILICEAYIFLSKKWTPNIIFTEECYE